MEHLNKIFESKVYCKKGCGTLGGASFYIDKLYRCHILDDTYFIIDSNGKFLVLEKNNPIQDVTKLESEVKFSDLFCTEKEIRKEKLNNLNEKR